MKKIVLVHGWGGSPGNDWFPWLINELKKINLKVIAPQLPDTDTPRIEKWVPALAEAIGALEEDMLLIGHSLGCQAIARYLETASPNIKVKAIFVAGFFDSLFRDEYEQADMETSDLWLKKPINLGKVKNHLKRSIYIISKDDPDVPLLNKDKFENELGSEVFVLNGYKHFNDKKIPLILEKLLEISK